MCLCLSGQSLYLHSISTNLYDFRIMPSNASTFASSNFLFTLSLYRMFYSRYFSWIASEGSSPSFSTPACISPSSSVLGFDLPRPLPFSFPPRPPSLFTLLRLLSCLPFSSAFIYSVFANAPFPQTESSLRWSLYPLCPVWSNPLSTRQSYSWLAPSLAALLSILILELVSAPNIESSFDSSSTMDEFLLSIIQMIFLLVLSSTDTSSPFVSMQNIWPSALFTRVQHRASRYRSVLFLQRQPVKSSSLFENQRRCTYDSPIIQTQKASPSLFPNVQISSKVFGRFQNQLNLMLTLVICLVQRSSFKDCSEKRIKILDWLSGNAPKTSPGNSNWVFSHTLPGNSLEANYHFTSTSCSSQRVWALTSPAVCQERRKN